MESPTNKEAIDRQERTKKKQMMYRRHRMKNSPRNAGSAKTSSSVTPEKTQTEAVNSDVEPPTLKVPPKKPVPPSTPPATNKPSTPEAKKVETPPRGDSMRLKRMRRNKPQRSPGSPTKRSMPPQSPSRPFDETTTSTTPVASPERPFDCVNGESPVHLPRRLRNVSSPAERKKKTDLIKQISRKKASVMSPANSPSQKERRDGAQNAGDKAAETEASDTPESPASQTFAKINEDEPLNEAQLQRKQLNDYVQSTKDEDVEYEDPPLEELQSEVSVATSGFDMRSIHDHPPDPPTPESDKEEPAADPSWDASKMVFASKSADVDGKTGAATRTDDLDIFETDSWAKTSASFPAMPNTNADIQAFANRLLADQMKDKRSYPGSISEEEKKEKEAAEPQALPPVDSSWDVENSAFKPPAPQKSNSTESAVDMFDTSSWGNIEAAFSDVSLSRLAQHPDIEAQFLRLMKEDLENREHQLTDEQKALHLRSQITTRRPMMMSRCWNH